MIDLEQIIPEYTYTRICFLRVDPMLQETKSYHGLLS